MSKSATPSNWMQLDSAVSKLNNNIYSNMCNLLISKWITHFICVRPALYLPCTNWKCSQLRWVAIVIFSIYWIAFKHEKKKIPPSKLILLSVGYCYLIQTNLKAVEIPGIRKYCVVSDFWQTCFKLHSWFTGFPEWMIFNHI